jgi:putative ABC transport system permease protein
MILTLTRKSLRARWGRSLFIAVSISLGVAFVSGSFVLADSLRSTFDSLFTRLNADIDLQVRGVAAFDSRNAQRDPVPAQWATTLAQVEGVARVSPQLTRTATLLDDTGKPISTGGAPAIGALWSGEGSGGIVLRSGVAPDGSDQVAIDKATADRFDITLDQRLDIATPTGVRSFTVVGIVGLGEADGFAGASLALFDPATAEVVLDSGGSFDAIDLALAPGTSLNEVKDRVENTITGRLEVVTGQQVADESADQVGGFVTAFGTGLSVFAFITAFVVAFIINNIFAITIGQRLRELALLRAIGANGSQVRRMIVTEALVLSFTATVLGIVGGLGVARGLIWLFDAAGAGFPPTDLVLAARTVVAAIVVGVGITMASVIVPARRAARIPPVAAMHPELGFGAISVNRRLVGGGILTGVGAVVFVLGLFVRPGGTIGLIVFSGAGALAIFLGVASLSSGVVRPVSRTLGWPFARLFGVPGQLARENAARQPRRTARTASALMIGVALVSAAAVFTESLRVTFVRILDRSVTADFVITDSGFQGLPPDLARTIAALPELSAVSPVRGIAAQVNGDVKQFGAVDPAPFDLLANIDVQTGSLADLAAGGVLVHRDPARDLGLSVGSQIDVTYQNGVTGSLEVVGVYADAALVGNWLISISTLEAVSTQPPRDFFVIARVADRVDAVAARFALQGALDAFPQAELRSNAEFRQQQEDQINQFLTLITALLATAIQIAVIGIAITLALSVFERTREIGLLRAVGMSRRQLRRAVRWEAVIVSLFGAVVGVVVGSLLGVALSSAVPDTIIDGVAFPVGQLPLVIGFAVLAGITAAWYPARKAAKMDILEAIATT